MIPPTSLHGANLNDRARLCDTAASCIQNRERKNGNCPPSYSLGCSSRREFPWTLLLSPRFTGPSRDKLCRHLRRCRDARLRTHYIIIVGLLNGHPARHMASILQIHRTTV